MRVPGSSPARPSRPAHGFTLVEILVVVAVIGIIVPIASLVLLKALDRSKQAATMADMRTIAMSIESYALDNDYPPGLEGDLTGVAPHVRMYNHTNLPLRDHWGHPYDYVGGVEGYTLTSFGKDGVDGPDLTPQTPLEFNRDIVLVNGHFKAEGRAESAGEADDEAGD